MRRVIQSRRLIERKERMLETLVARARFYDITGYWIPGNVTI